MANFQGDPIPGLTDEDSPPPIDCAKPDKTHSAKLIIKEKKKLKLKYSDIIFYLIINYLIFIIKIFYFHLVSTFTIYFGKIEFHRKNGKKRQVISHMFFIII